MPHFTPGCLKDPRAEQDKEAAALAFKSWWRAIPTSDAVIFSDGSERTENGKRFVGYGYAVYEGTRMPATSCASICTEAHVFDAEAIGALWGLKKAIEIKPGANRLWLCIDSTSVIWCAQGRPAVSSNWAFAAL